MAYGEQLAMQMGSEAASGIMGMVMGGINDQRQIDQQRKLNELNKGMIDYNYKKQLEQWNATNYEAQMAHIKNAGLNPALLYGMGGAGGATTGTPTTGGGAEAPKGGGEMIAAQGMGIQMQLLQAQKENIQASTEKIKAETANAPLQGANIKAETANKEMQLELQQIEQYVKAKTQNMAVSIIESEMRQAYEEANIKVNEGKISRDTIKTEIDTKKAELANILARTTLANAQKELAKQGIQVNQAQMDKWTAEVANLTTIANQRDQEIAIQKFKAEVEANNPGIWQVMGGFIKQASGKLGELFGDPSNAQTVPDPKNK